MKENEKQMNSNKIKIIIALMLAMFLGAVEGTVVTTAIPTIAKQLHGFESISFVFSAYLLTSAISTPIYGKLSDLYGRKNVLSIGIIIFITGSFLCGLSQTMTILIIFRAIQGLGAGAIFTVTYTIVGDIFSLEERPKIQGGLGSVWGIASLVGPFLGGVLIDTLSWHWIFYINIPFGILSIILIQRNLKETYEKKKHSIDFAGIITLSAAMLIFLNIFLSKEYTSIHQSILITSSIVVTILLLYLFYIIERNAKEPIIPFDIFTKSSTIVNIISFFVSAILIGINVYIPIYIQNVLGYSPTISGLALISMTFSWLIASVVLGKCMVKYGEKNVTLYSLMILFVGVVSLLSLRTNSSLLLVIVCSFIIGFGFGGVLTILTIVIQESVDYAKRGVATATNSLLRTLGQTIGVSMFGSIFNYNITRYFDKIGIRGMNPNNLYGTAMNQVNVSREVVKHSLNNSLQKLYIVLIILAGMSLILWLLKPTMKRVDEVRA